ncbi:GlcG/HbpS family heme-binding protein [Desulforhopalus sp. 52FAK]
MEITANINNNLSRVLSNVARKKAVSIAVPMVIAFTDARGELVRFERMDRALPVSTDIAVNKAYTAAAIRIPTHEVAGIVQTGQSLYGLELTNQGRIVIFGGGYPLKVAGDVVGAIGISGGSVEEDMSVAEAAVTAFAEMLEMAASLKDLLPDTLLDFDSFYRRAESIDALNGLSADVLEGAFYLMQNR